MQCSWVPEKNVAAKVIEEFECSTSVKAVVNTTSYNRQEVAVVSSEKCFSGMGIM